jgi:hypothetical protein
MDQHRQQQDRLRDILTQHPGILAATGIILAVAVLFRCVGALNGLWLDEIWSLDLAATLASPGEVFTRLHHENNHYLNTLYIYLVGNRGDWPGYRIPSLLAGSGTLLMAWLIGLRRSRADALCALVTVSFSYVLILYSSEARGYAAAVFCAFLAHYLLEEYLEHRRGATALGFALVTILGLLSHLMFVTVLCAAFLQSCRRFQIERLPTGRTVSSLAALFAGPLAFSLLLYWVDIRKITEGGGDEVPLLAAFRNSLAWVLGTTPSPLVSLASCLAAVAILAAGVLLLRRERRDLPLFYLAIVLCPLLLALLRGSSSLYVRHFLLAIAFLQLLFAFVLADLYRRIPRGRVVSLLLLAAYLLPNLWNTSSLIRNGRGDFAEVVAYLATVTRGNEIRVGSDHDFRVGTLLRFQDKALLRGKTLRDLGEKDWPPGGPEWLIYHKESYEDPAPTYGELTDREGNHYGLIRTFHTAPLTGFHWYIFHNLGMTVN